MTTTKNSKKNNHDDNDKDRPLSREEILSMYFRLLMLPVVAGPILLFGAYLYTYPKLPTPWFGFYFYLATLCFCGCTGMTLLLDCPRIARERMTKHRPRQGVDTPQEVYFYKVAAILFIIALIVMPYDAIQHADVFPRSYNYAGALVTYASYLWMIYVFRTNQYASKIVYKNENHQLIQVGPYRFVRHPMYSALIPFIFGNSICLGSFWGIVPFGFMSLLVIQRIQWEEEFLIQELFGDKYKEYQGKVPYKLCPYIY